jgi:hypothetical protein
LHQPHVLASDLRSCETAGPRRQTTRLAIKNFQADPPSIALKNFVPLPIR